MYSLMTLSSDTLADATLINTPAKHSYDKNRDTEGGVTKQTAQARHLNTERATVLLTDSVFSTVG